MALYQCEGHLIDTSSGNCHMIDHRLPPLPKKTCVKIITIIEALQSVETIAQLTNIVREEIRSILPHDMTIFGIGNPKTLIVDEIINIDYSEKFISTVTSEQANGVIIKSPVVNAAISSGNYVEVNNALAFQPEYTEWTEAARQCGIRNSFAKGGYHLGGKKFIYHCFTNSNTKRHDDFQRIFNILFPHLDSTILRLFGMMSNEQSEVNITRREQEVLELLCFGYVNKQIADKLNISLYTVKAHMNSIFYKLESKNRTQAIMKAMDLNLLKNATG
jgi:DNA-binding CsgD family transcriptional regulator